MQKRSESFGRLLKAGTGGIAHIEGKTQQAVEAELGELIGVAGVTLQRYKAGYLPPDPRSVEVLAEVCVQRGLMGRLWLEHFCEAARLPAYSGRVLAARLFPEAPAARERTLRPNLPPPTYGRFVMRKLPYEGVMDGLRSALPVTLIVSLGGMGKTSLARAVAGACLEGDAEAPRFAVATWVSDKDRPGTTNLSTTLDEIARALDYPGLLTLPFFERQREVENLLRQQPALLVVDNAETITDGALFAWLAQVPPPSKALVTSRFILPALSSAYVVELGPMAEHETRALIADWLPRARLRGVANALDQLAPVANSTGGNPKAIELALGLIQYRSRDTVIEDLRVAREGLFDDLFDHAWALLDGAAQRVLFALTLFPASVAAEALAYCADLSSPAFTHSAERLVGLSLLDVERDDLRVAPRYNAHALVRAYALARFSQLPLSSQSQLRERWLHWCLDTALSVGFCWDNLDRLDALDHEHEVIQAAIAWAADHDRDEVVPRLVEGIRYYYNVRGFWGTEELRNHERRALSARRTGDRDNEILALAHLVQTLSKQDRLTEAAHPLERLVAIGEASYQAHLPLMESRSAESSASTLRDDAMFEYGHARALYARAQGELVVAERFWRHLLRLSEVLGGQKYVVNRRWLATVLLKQGEIMAARELYRASREDARIINDVRSVVGNTLKLVMIDLSCGELSGAADSIEQCRTIAMCYHDRRRLAETHALMAQLLILQGDPAHAYTELEMALDLFVRLGMRREAREARETIATLSAPLPDGDATIH